MSVISEHQGQTRLQHSQVTRLEVDNFPYSSAGNSFSAVL
jgi:hypothetical protein